MKRFLAVLAATAWISAPAGVMSADPPAGNKGAGESAKAQPKSGAKKALSGKAKAKQKSTAKKGPGSKAQKAEGAKLPASSPSPPPAPVKGGGAASSASSSGKPPLKFNPKGEQKP